MQRVQIAPVLDDGKLSGVRVSASGADAALLAQAGLQPGDVVTAVNGQRVDSIERGQQIAAGAAGKGDFIIVDGAGFHRENVIAVAQRNPAAAAEELAQHRLRQRDTLDPAKGDVYAEITAVKTEPTR